MGWTVWGFNPGRGELFHTVQTSPVIHPASCTTGTGSFQEIKQTEHGADQSPLSSVVNGLELYLRLPSVPYIVMS